MSEWEIRESSGSLQSSQAGPHCVVAETTAALPCVSTVTRKLPSDLCTCAYSLFPPSLSLNTYLI
ncbi:mCG123414, isoform CRA_b [Mus musculus]|nr:mCG123414, isoform CRA_b [Mus musculus]